MSILCERNYWLIDARSAFGAERKKRRRRREKWMLHIEVNKHVGSVLRVYLVPTFVRLCAWDMLWRWNIHDSAGVCKRHTYTIASQSCRRQANTFVARYSLLSEFKPFAFFMCFIPLWRIVVQKSFVSSTSVCSHFVRFSFFFFFSANWFISFFLWSSNRAARDASSLSICEVCVHVN